MLASIFWSVLAFVTLWYGSGLIVESVRLLAHKIHIASFAMSFFVLGLLTSIPELAVGITALNEDRPEIFVGTLLGGVVVMFLFVIPILAIVSKKGVRIHKHLSSRNLLVILGIIAVPALFSLDGVITNTEGFILVALYVSLFFIIRTRKGVLNRVEKVLSNERVDWRHSHALRLALGVVLVFLSSRFVVDQTILFSERYNISTFLIGLMVLSIGANLPELALALRSRTDDSEDIALGDYLGSAASNTLLFGVLTLVNNGEVITAKEFKITFLVIITALASFYLIARGKSRLTKKEGFILLGCYLLFLLIEYHAI